MEELLLVAFQLIVALAKVAVAEGLKDHHLRPLAVYATLQFVDSPHCTLLGVW